MPVNVKCLTRGRGAPPYPVTRGTITGRATLMTRVRALSRTVGALEALAIAVFVRKPTARRSSRNFTVIVFDAPGARLPT